MRSLRLGNGRDQWKRVSLTNIALLMVALGLLCTIGCTDFLPDRLSHYHSDSNAKLAQAASDSFEQFTAETSGLSALLDKNVDAQKALEETVANESQTVLENELATLSTNVTWVRLRAQTLDGLGVLADFTVNGKSASDLDHLSPAEMQAAVIRGGRVFSRRVHARQIRLAAAADILHLLATAQEAIIDEAKTSADAAASNRTSQQPGAPATKPVAQLGADQASRIQFIEQLVSTLNSVGQEMHDNANARQRATAQQARLLSEVAQSRDPASAWILAAVTDTGLDSDSIALLDVYIDSLDTRLDALKAELATIPQPAKSPQPGNGDSGKADPMAGNAWTELIDALNKAVVSRHLAEMAVIFEQSRTSGLVNAAKSPATRNAEANPLPADAKMMLLDTAHLSHAAIESASLMSERYTTPSRDSTELPPKTQNTLDGLKAAVMAGTAVPGISATSRPDASQPDLFDVFAKQDVGNIVGVKMLSTLPNTGAHEKVATDLREALQAAGTDDGTGLRGALQRLDVARTRLVEAGRRYRNAVSAVPVDAKSAIGFAKKDLPGSASESQKTAVGQQFLINAFYADPEAALAVRNALAASLASSQTKTKPAGSSIPSLRVMPSAKASPAKKATTQVAATQQSTREEAIQSAAKTVGDLLNSIEAEQQAQTSRIAEFQSELTSIETDLRGENVRHAQAMYGIAEAEIARWNLLEDLNAECSAEFVNSDPARQAGADVRKKELQDELGTVIGDLQKRRDTEAGAMTKLQSVDEENVKLQARAAVDQASAGVRLMTSKVAAKQRQLQQVAKTAYTPLDPTAVLLFADNANLARYNTGIPSPPATDPAKQPADKSSVVHSQIPSGAQVLIHQHPKIEPTDNIIGSIRRLAETAKGFHTASASEVDPTGWQVLASNTRLYKAVQIINGHLLIQSMNRSLGQENLIQLHTELAEHGLHLDAFDARIEEAGYRLTLGDLKAFHSSGVTDADIQAVETATLSFIIARH